MAEIEFPSVKIGQKVMYTAPFSNYAHCTVNRVFAEGFTIKEDDDSNAEYRMLKVNWNDSVAKQLVFMHHEDGRPVMKHTTEIGWPILTALLAVGWAITLCMR